MKHEGVPTYSEVICQFLTANSSDFKISHVHTPQTGIQCMSSEPGTVVTSNTVACK